MYVLHFNLVLYLDYHLIYMWLRVDLCFAIQVGISVSHQNARPSGYTVPMGGRRRQIEGKVHEGRRLTVVGCLRASAKGSGHVGLLDRI